MEQSLLPTIILCSWPSVLKHVDEICSKTVLGELAFIWGRIGVADSSRMNEQMK